MRYCFREHARIDKFTMSAKYPEPLREYVKTNYILLSKLSPKSTLYAHNITKNILKITYGKTTVTVSVVK